MLLCVEHANERWLIVAVGMSMVVRRLAVGPADICEMWGLNSSL